MLLHIKKIKCFYIKKIDFCVFKYRENDRKYKDMFKHILNFVILFLPYYECNLNLSCPVNAKK